MSVQTLDREAMEKLAALGYIGAGAEPRAAEATNLADPKDFIALFDRLRQANSAVRERRFDEAIPILKAVLADDPKNAFATLVLGSAYMGMGEQPRGDRPVPPLPRARAHELLRPPVDRDLPRAARRARRGPAGGRGRPRSRPEVHRRAGPEGGCARGAGRARRRHPGPARGHRHRPREADDPARPREDPGRGRAPGRGPGRVRDASSGSSPTPCPVSPGWAPSSPGRAISKEPRPPCVALSRTTQRRRRLASTSPRCSSVRSARTRPRPSTGGWPRTRKPLPELRAAARARLQPAP